jgi:hypothetical protein
MQNLHLERGEEKRKNMKYRVLTPLAKIGQTFVVGAEIEISDKAEAERMIAANIVAPIVRGIRVETADLKPVGVETTATHVAAAKIGRKKG